MGRLVAFLERLLLGPQRPNLAGSKDYGGHCKVRTRL